MNDPLRSATLLTATITSGLLAGLFYAYSASVMRGLRRTADLTFVEAMREINVAILNGWFALGFVGAPLSTLLATALHLGEGGSAALPLTLLASLLSVVTLVVTFAANVPLNDQLAAQAGDATIARRQFEARWVRWNLARTASSTAAFCCLAGALAVQG